MKKLYNSISRKYEIYIIPVILCLVVFLTIGYSTFSADLGISGISAVVRVQKDVRISGISLSSVGGDAVSLYEEYNVKNVYTSVSLPNSNSSATYDVVVHNLGNVKAGILEITGLPSNLKYSISNYNLKDPLCDDNNSSKCMLGSTTTLHIKIEYDENGYDSSSVDYDLNLSFNFKSIFSITYKNITDNNYPKSILEDETLNITFTDDIPDEVSATGVTSYNYVSPVLTISNPTGDVVVSGATISRHYEVLEFDGSDYVNTGVYLFNEENIGKNFEISFDITDVGTDQTSQGTILNSMEEKSPYPGFVIRLQSDTSKIEFNSPKIKNRDNILVSTIERLVIKRINDIYYIQVNNGNVETLGTYKGTTFDVPVTLGSSPDVNRYFKGKLENVDILVYDPETYTVHFDANGGTGTMNDQVIRKDDNVNLTANVFEKEGYLFDGWNTEPDGSGTSYSDESQVINLGTPNSTVTLYAMWEVGFTYYVRFNENGGTGTMGIQSLTYGSSFNLNTNTFTKTDRTFVRWNTEADGTGVDYEDGGVVKNLTKVEGDTVDLYAVWARDYYYKASEVYTGSNCDKTNIFLYSSANAGYDYEISFEISNIGSNPNQSTLMNAMYEVQPWPGILVRTTSNNAEYEVQMNGGSGNLTKKYKVNETNKFTIRRISGKIYVSVNDGAFELTRDHSNIATFDTVPVVFGCSVQANANLTEQRYFKGTLNNMRAFLFE